MNGYKFSLPTEAQWEYACRAGTTTVYHFGDTLAQQQANFGGNQTKEVGSYPANVWGLRDMHGNVWEWCQDWYGDYPSGAVTDPTGVPNGSFRVFRGGCWLNLNNAECCRSAHRTGAIPSGGSRAVGLRLSLIRADAKAESPPLPPTVAQLPEPYNQMGAQVWEAITNGNEAEADRIAQECIKLAETQSEHPNLLLFLRLELGKWFLDAEMYDSAHRHLSEVAKHGGKNVYPLALCKAKSGDVDGGFTILLDEIDRTPSAMPQLLPAILVLQAQVKPSETMFEKIDGLMNHVETKEPVILEAILSLTDWWIIRGKPERAIPLYEEGLTRDNLDDTRTFVFSNNLARLYSEVLGQHQKALDVVNKALETNRDQISLLDTKGLILINAGNSKEAIPVLQRVVELSNQHPIFCMHLAYALHLGGRDAESRQYFDAAKEQLVLLVPNMTKENKAMYDALLLAHP